MRKMLMTLGLGLAFGIGAMFADIQESSKTSTTGLGIGFEIGFNSVEARGRSSRSSFRSSRSSRSSFSFSRKSSPKRASKSLWNRSSSKPKATSSGYKKSTAPTTRKAPKAVTGNAGYKKGGAAAPRGRTLSKGSKSAKAIQKKAASKGLAANRKANSKFSKPARPMTNASTFNKTPLYKANRPVTMTRYYSRRDTFYSGRNWVTPGYAYRSSSRFGMYDGLFMWAMLDGIHDRRMYYNRRGDAGMREWRREADRMARDNAELRTKLARLDENVNQLKSQGVAVDPNYVPEGVDPGMILAAEVATGAGSLVLNFGSGGKAGNYYAFCLELKSSAGSNVPVTCNNTGGSVENLNGLVSGKFDAALVQTDVYNKWVRDNPGQKIDGLQASLYPEVVFMLANKKAGIDAIGDVNAAKHKIFAFGSGAMKTLQGFADQDSGYANIARKAIKVSPTVANLQLVANTPNAVMFYVCGMNCGLIKQADAQFGNTLVMGAVDDWDFNDAVDQFGTNIYRFVKVPTIYKNLQPSGWVTSGDVETLAMDAVLIVSQDWVTEKGVDGLSKLETAIWPAMSKIQARVGVPQ